MTSQAILAASLEQFALEIRGLQKTEIGEVEVLFAAGQKGSSATPHKRNPIGCEQITGLARLIRGNALAALENVALLAPPRHLALSLNASSAGQLIVLDHMLRRFTKSCPGWSSIAIGCSKSQRSRGVVFSGERAAGACAARRVT